MSGLLRSLSEGVRAAHEADRRANPHHFAGGSEVLFAANVANLLGCEVDDLNKPPLSTIPRRSVGDQTLYLREQVIEFLRGLQGRVPVQPVAPCPRTKGRLRGRRSVKRQLERAIQVARSTGAETLEIGFRHDGSPVVRLISGQDNHDIASEIEVWASGR